MAQPKRGEVWSALRLPINFHEMKVTDGISRLILPGANL